MVRIGTSHFTSINAAYTYYTPYCYDKKEKSLMKKAVQQMVDDEEIHIGPPPVKDNEKIVIIDDGLRYAIEYEN